MYRCAPEGSDESWLHERIEVRQRADRQAPVTWTAMTSGFRTGDVRELESSLRMLCWKPATFSLTKTTIQGQRTRKLKDGLGKDMNMANFLDGLARNHRQ